VRTRLAIFDSDGTLADSFPWFARVLNGVADKYRFRPVAPDEIEALRGLNARELIAHLGVARWKVPLIARHMRKMKARERIPLFPGTEAMLSTLSQRGVSSDNEKNIRATLGRELSALVKHYACGASLFGKASKFKAVLRASGIPASETIAIGDELRDLEAARAAGIAFGAVSWGYTAPEALRAHAPELMFTSMDEICDRLSGSP
jgi:phosphoglycolate phosphatase